MPSSLHEAATVEDVARSAHKLAREALEHGMRANRRLDELEQSHSRTVESMKSMFATAVRESSKESAQELLRLSNDSKAQSASINALIGALTKQEAARARELRTNRALFVVLAVVLTVFVEYCRNH